MDLYDFQKFRGDQHEARTAMPVRRDRSWRTRDREFGHADVPYRRVDRRADFAVVVVRVRVPGPTTVRLECSGCHKHELETAYSAAQLAKHKKRRCPACVTAAELARKKPRVVRAAAPKPKVTVLGAGVPKTKPVARTSHLGSFMREFVDSHAHRLDRCGVTPLSIVPAPVCDTLASKFLALAQHTDGDTELVFHGTALNNLESICRRGLVMPGRSGVRVAHGSSYGVGIYTSTEASMSAGYCSGSDVMFVCALLAGSSAVRRPCNNIRVADREGVVLPLFMMRWVYGNNGNSGDTRQYRKMFDGCFV